MGIAPRLRFLALAAFGWVVDGRPSQQSSSIAALGDFGASSLANREEEAGDYGSSRRCRRVGFVSANSGAQLSLSRRLVWTKAGERRNGYEKSNCWHLGKRLFVFVAQFCAAIFSSGGLVEPIGAFHFAAHDRDADGSQFRGWLP